MYWIKEFPVGFVFEDVNYAAGLGKYFWAKSLFKSLVFCSGKLYGIWGVILFEYFLKSNWKVRALTPGDMRVFWEGKNQFGKGIDWFDKHFKLSRLSAKLIRRMSCFVCFIVGLKIPFGSLRRTALAEYSLPNQRRRLEWFS